LTPDGRDLLRIPLDPERRIDLSCQIAGRELTQDEWNWLVPGNEERRYVLRLGLFGVAAATHLVATATHLVATATHLVTAATHLVATATDGVPVH
jgi:hypothetical protein